jgi:Glyoxalase-like domain
MSNHEDATAATISLTLDCADPERLAPFWSEALRYQQGRLGRRRRPGGAPTAPVSPE